MITNKKAVFKHTKKSIDIITDQSRRINGWNKTYLEMADIKSDVYVYSNRLFLFVEEI